MNPNFAEIGEMLNQIILNGFSVNCFRLWKLPADSPPVWYVAIQSNELRETPELNSRCLKGADLTEALAKSANVPIAAGITLFRLDQKANIIKTPARMKYVHPWEKRVKARTNYRKSTFNLIAASVTMAAMLANVALEGHWLLWLAIPFAGLWFALRAGFCFAIARSNDV